jgi:hypothetical protein
MLLWGDERLFLAYFEGGGVLLPLGGGVPWEIGKITGIQKKNLGRDVYRIFCRWWISVRHIRLDRGGRSGVGWGISRAAGGVFGSSKGQKGWEMENGVFFFFFFFSS